MNGLETTQDTNSINQTIASQKTTISVGTTKKNQEKRIESTSAVNPMTTSVVTVTTVAEDDIASHEITGVSDVNDGKTASATVQNEIVSIVPDTPVTIYAAATNITAKQSFIIVANTIQNSTNSTKTSLNSKSSSPILLGAMFGGLGVIVLISSIITYVLIKQGYIKVFNPPRTRIKDTERSRIIDSSSSSISNASPSRR